LEKVVVETAVHAVKIEGGADAAKLIRESGVLGIAIMAHIGLNPKRLNDLALRVQGTNWEELTKLLKAAGQVEAAEAYAILRDAVTEKAATCITERLSIPTIGIGSGRKCDGAGLVSLDLLGITGGRVPKFAKQYLRAKEDFTDAFRCFVNDVQEGRFPGPEHVYHMSSELICRKPG